jgi:hypothetical protein
MQYQSTLTRRLQFIAALATLIGTAACGPFHHTASTTPAKLFFTNESLDQADVYAVIPGSQQIRIGTVMAGRTDTLTVPADIVGRGENITVVARLLAHSGTVSSGPLPIHPGDQLVVRLPIDQKLLVVLPTGQ